ncbi:MAG: hypothetical protein ACODAQ_00925 [Phycisphaeraceae bacterium]
MAKRLLPRSIWEWLRRGRRAVRLRLNALVLDWLKAIWRHQRIARRFVPPDPADRATETPPSLRASVERSLRCAVFYPQMPDSRAAIYKMVSLLGMRMSDDASRYADVYIRWEDTTFGHVDETLQRLGQRARVLNIGCTDISKTHVENVFANTFGYGSVIDPRRHHGPAVEKSIWNAGHSGRIVQCPLAEPAADVIYQLPINNVEDGQTILDLRVPIVGGMVPFVYLKRRPVANRFANINSAVDLAEPETVFSHAELADVRRFAENMALDYGEIDILRNQDDSRIYIVDVNNTPFGPPREIDSASGAIAMHRLATAFEEQFLRAPNLKRPVQSELAHVA